MNFVGLRDAGDPVELAVLLAGGRGRDRVFSTSPLRATTGDTIADVVRRTCREVFVPVTVGGGIRTADDLREILRRCR